MDAQHWEDQLRHSEHLEGLLDRLQDPDGLPVAFVVGSALSLPERDGLPGVPGVDGWVTIARGVVERRRPKALTQFDQAVGGKDGSEKYATAFEFVRRIGQDVVNEVAHTATLKARSPHAGLKEGDDRSDQDLDGWVLSRGTRALGQLLTEFPDRYRGPVLTTNFDPLISVAIECAGGRARRIVFDRDRDPPHRAEERGDETHVVHLHGYWRDSDTIHTIDQLGARRERLARWCEEVLRGRLLLVVGYGGWDDDFMRMIASLTEPGKIGLEVAWAFYSARPVEIIGQYARLLERLESWRSSGRLHIYTGIDAHDLFEQLLEHVRPAAPAGPLTTQRLSQSGTIAQPTRAKGYLHLVRSVSEGAATVTAADTTAWSRLSAEQQERLALVMRRLTWLLDGEPAPWPSRAHPEISPPAILRLRLPKVDEVLSDLGSIRPHAWPDMKWALHLDEARNDAEKVAEHLKLRVARSHHANRDPDGRDWKASAEALERTLTRIVEVIRGRYPQAQARS